MNYKESLKSLKKLVYEGVLETFNSVEKKLVSKIYLHTPYLLMIVQVIWGGRLIQILFINPPRKK